MNADGSDPRQITETPAREYHPTFSPDGSRIAFMTLSRRRLKLSILEQTADDTWEIIDLDVEGEDPAWSPDGTQIVYQKSEGGDFEIMLIDAYGSNPRTLTQNRADDLWPDWWLEPQAASDQ